MSVLLSLAFMEQNVKTRPTATCVIVMINIVEAIVSMVGSVLYMFYCVNQCSGGNFQCGK